MKKGVAVPVRLLDLSPQDDPAKLAVLVRSAVQSVAEEDVPLIRWRVRDTLRRQGEKRRRMLRVVLMGAFLFFAGGVVGAVMGPVLGSRGQSETPARLDPSAPPARAVHKRSPRLSPTLPPTLTPGDDVLAPASEVAAASGTEAEARPRQVPQGWSNQAPPRSGALDPAEQPTPSQAAPMSPGAAHRASALPALAPGLGAAAQPAQPRTTPTVPVSLSAPGARAVAAARPGLARPAAAARQAAPTASASDFVVSPGPAVAWPSPGEHELSPPTSAPAAEAAGIAIASPHPLESLQRTPRESGEARIASPWTPTRPATGPASIPLRGPNADARPLATSEAQAAGPASEQALLTKAFRALRVARDANAALAVLDAYAAGFPSGALAPEAARLRTEALLLLGRRQAALAELERDDPNAMPAGDERRLLRGELRAGAGRWRAAAEDFDAVAHSNAAGGAAADAKSSERLERALWGRASACSHLGDDAGARSALQAYLARFPHGRFAIDAAHLLGNRR